MRLRYGWVVAALIGALFGLSAGPVAAQAPVVAPTVSVGTNLPPVGSTVRLQGLGTTGGTEVLLIETSSFGVRRRVLVKTDLPGTTVFTDQANSFGAFLQTFGGGLTSNGLLTIGGANDLLLGTGGMRVASGSILFRNIADTGNNATIGDTVIALNQNTAVTGTFSASALATLTGGFSAGANSSVTGTLGVSLSGSYGTSLTVGTTLGVTGVSTLTGGFNSNAASAVNAALTITGLTTAAKITTTGLYGVTNPLTFYATDSVTALIQLYDAGRYVATNSGADAVWEYHGLGNASGSRVWRAGNIGGNYLIQSGNDAASSWTNLLRSTSSAGVPNGLYWGTGVRSVSPDLDFTTDLGSYPTQYANLWIRNLWATTLVNQDVIATIGGAVLVTPTTKIELAVSAAATSFQTTHNEMVSGDIAYISENLATEFVQVTAGPLAGSSSISYIADGQAVGTSVTIPAHQVGDLIVIFAFANTGTVPALGAQFTNVANCNLSGGTTGSRVGYMIADTTTEVSGTWTSATSLMVHVYRSSAGNMPVPGACAGQNAAASTALTYPALTLTKTDHSSWVARAAISSAGTNIQTAPSGYVLRANNTAVPETASFDSNGRIQATSVAQSAALTITSANWRSVTLEIVGIGLTPYTYTVTRGYGGVFAARAWPAGVAIANTGQAGDGGINMYAIQSIKGSGEKGPTIQGYERTSATYNALSTRWALGNLNGLYNYGAVDVYGLAAGNAADVWFSAEATNGIRFFDQATTVNAHFALDGSILLGQAGAGQANTYLSPTEWLLRRGTVNAQKLSVTGLEMFDDAGTRQVFLDRANSTLTLGQVGAGLENLHVTPTSVAMRINTANHVLLDSTNGLQFSDGTTVRATLNGTTGLLLGITAAGNGNIELDTSGNAKFKSGTVVRMQIDAGNGMMRFLDPAGTSRMTLNSTAFEMFGPAGQRGLLMNSTAIYLGDTVTANAPQLAMTPTQMQFCVSGVGCTLTFSGTTGDITSNGSIQVGAAGHIRGGATAYGTGTGFWLGNDAGTYKFYIGNGTGTTDNYLTWTGSSLVYSGGMNALGGLNIRSNNGSGNSIETNLLTLKIANVNGAGAIQLLASSGGISLSAVGGSISASANGSTGTGFTGSKTVRAAGGATDCTMTFVGGLFTGGC